MGIILPRTNKEGEYYLSYSQISTWKKSKREYIRQYFLGEGFDGNAYTDFGSKVGEAIENNDFSEFSKKEQKFLKTIPRYDEFEREIKLEMVGYHIKGFIDSNSLVNRKENSVPIQVVEKLTDYKTGEIDKKQAEYEAGDYFQVDLYAIAILKETGYLPKEVTVTIIDRTGNVFKGEKLKLGNRYVQITKKVDDKRIAEVLDEVDAVAHEISEYYQLYLRMNKLI